MMKVLLLLAVVLTVESCVPRYSPEPGCLCGVPGDKSRIVGGEDARSNQYPWQVGLMFTDQDTESFCGGTLLSSDTVLTAAHCMFISPTVYVALPKGEITLENATKIEASKILVHPYFDFFTLNNDFAIIKLSRPVEQFDDSTRPICLPDPTKSYDDNPAEVTGWGSVDVTNLISPENLQTLNVTTMNNKECQDMFNNLPQSVIDEFFAGTVNPITTNMLCAQHSTDAAKQPYKGDSGGPLITLNKEGSHYHQIGVVSWGLPGPTPGVFARVTDQLYWIMKQVSGETCPPPSL